MKKIYLTIAALMSWVMMSVTALAVDVIVVSHGQANDPFFCQLQKTELIKHVKI